MLSSPRKQNTREDKPSSVPSNYQNKIKSRQSSGVLSQNYLGSFVRTRTFGIISLCVLLLALSIYIFFIPPQQLSQFIDTTNSTSSASIMNIFSSSNKDEEWRKANTVYDFAVKNIDNEDVKLDKYKGQVLLIVNVASKCGFTKTNYKELNELYAKYKDRGLAILGFPCNQFGHQEPGCDVDIKEFMKKNGVEWDMFAKVDVNGDNAIPLYSWLKSKAGGTLFDAIKWNFTKFLINKDGIPVQRYAPQKNPLEFEKEIEAELAK